jgi:hypothetical protein
MQYVLAQDVRYSRPRMGIITASADDIVAAYAPAARRLVLVAVTGAAQTVTR